MSWYHDEQPPTRREIEWEEHHADADWSARLADQAEERTIEYRLKRDARRLGHDMKRHRGLVTCPTWRCTECGAAVVLDAGVVHGEAITVSCAAANEAA